MTEELIQCWKCKSDMTLTERGDNDGDCLYCGAEIDLDDYLAKALADNRALRAKLPSQEAKAAPAEVPYALRQWAMDDEPESTLFDEGYNAARRWVKMQLEKPAEPFQKPTLLKECNVRYSDSSGGVCRSEYKGGPEQTAEPTEAVEVVAWLSPETTEAVIPGAGYDLLVSEDCHLEPLMTVAQHRRLMAAKDGDAVKLDGLIRANQQMGRIYLHFKTTEQHHAALRELRALLGQK